MPASSQARRKPLHFLPVVASAVTVGVTWQLVLHSNIGIFNYWLKLIGVSDPNLLNNTVTAIYAVVLVDIWKTFGISAIILVSAIQNIPESLFEASAIDGAGKVRQFFSVTLPSIVPSFWFLLMPRIDGMHEFGIFTRIMLPLVTPTMITVLLLSINNCWNDLFWPMIVASKSSMRTLSNGLVIFIGNRTDNYSSAFTAATVSMIPLLILYIYGQKYFVAGQATSGIKG